MTKINEECIRRSAICPHIKNIGDRPDPLLQIKPLGVSGIDQRGEADVKNIEWTWKRIIAWVSGGVLLFGVLVGGVITITSLYGGL